MSCLTSSKESHINEFSVDDNLRKNETEGRHQMNEGRSRTPVVPGVTNETPWLGQDGGRVHGTRRQVVAQLEPVVGQVPDLEHERDEVEGQKNDPGPHQPDEDVELEVRLFPVLPWQGQVDEKPRNAFVNYVRLQKNVNRLQ